MIPVPVGVRQTCDEFQSEADEAICAAMPDPFHAVGYWYGNFDPTTDEEVRTLLARAERELPIAASR